jgi:prefoldin subunit 5
VWFGSSSPSMPRDVEATIEGIPDMLWHLSQELDNINRRVNTTDSTLTESREILKEFGSVLHYEDDRIQLMHKEITQLRDAQLSMQKTLERIEVYLKARDSREVYEGNQPYWNEIRKLQSSGDYEQAWKRLEDGAPHTKYFTDEA